MNEGAPGGFALAYKVLSGFEDSGRCRRGYFIETLGAAQFATGGTIDRLRAFVTDRTQEPERAAVALAATDPASPFGAALPWPVIPPEAGTGHRPGRKAGAIVVLVDGALTLYVERGGKSLLSFTDDEANLAPAARALASLITRGRVDKLAIETVNGAFILGTPLGDALSVAGFLGTPRGLRLRV
jgi:ATP-dependent Lhr-like helicase